MTMLLTISEAAKQSGAPSQPTIHRMTRNKLVPGFLSLTAEGWRVDTGSPEWAAYVQGAPRRALPQTLGGNLVKKAKGKAPPAAGERPGGGGNQPAAGKKAGENPGGDKKKSKDQELTVQKAAEAKIIYNARREKLKMEQDEIKTNAMKKLFVDRAEAEYWLSFIQRAVTDGFSAVKRAMPEAKRLYLAGDDAAAERAVSAALKTAWERARQSLQDALDGGEEEP